MTAALAAELVAYLRGGEVPLPEEAEVDEETSLLRSGLLDSLALFRLLEWIEAELGEPVDATEIDLLAEWDTPRSVAEFVSRARGG